jgi:hypothetical protein
MLPDKPNYEVVDAIELAQRWRVPVSWIREQTRGRACDPLPCVRGFLNDPLLTESRLRKLLQDMTTRMEIHRIVKEELLARGWWKNRTRGRHAKRKAVKGWRDTETTTGRVLGQKRGCSENPLKATSIGGTESTT